jgi:FAD/FMN-containing dehydrogenase
MGTSAQPHSLLAELCALAGPDAVLPGDQAGDACLLDQRQLFRGHPLAVVLPGSTAEVAALVRWCHEHRIGIVPQGGNTGYCGGATPDASGGQLVLALRRMNRIRDTDARNYSLIAEAGCVLADVQQAAAAVDRFFPLSLGSAGSCQIGGNLATNAGGVNVVRHGMARAQVLGIEAVLPDGRIWNGLNTLRKDNTGYDLVSLLVGSEGTLGVITAAALRLQPAPREVATAMLSLPAAAGAMQLLEHLRAATGDQLSSLEYMPREVVALAIEQLPGLRTPLPLDGAAFVLVELAGAAGAAATLEHALAAAHGRGLIIDAAIARSEAQRGAFWRLREAIPEAQRRLGASIKHDISLPLSKLTEFIARVESWVQANVPEGMLVCYGHLGDGNLHCNVGQRAGTERACLLARQQEIHHVIHELVAGYGGSISAEHGIGQLKRATFEHYASPVKLAIMRQVKQALDPHWLMNPGKLLSATD